MNGYEIVAILVFIAATATGLPFLGKIILVLVAVFACFLLVQIFKKGVSPAATKVREEGLVGLGKAAYEKLLKPVLYGRRGSN